MTEEDLDLLLKVLHLKGVPNKIFQLLDPSGKGYVRAGLFRDYLNSMKSDFTWIKEKIDGTIAAMLTFGGQVNLLATLEKRCILTVIPT